MTSLIIAMISIEKANNASQVTICNTPLYEKSRELFKRIIPPCINNYVRGWPPPLRYKPQMRCLLAFPIYIGNTIISPFGGITKIDVDKMNCLWYYISVRSAPGNGCPRKCRTNCSKRTNCSNFGRWEAVSSFCYYWKHLWQCRWPLQLTEVKRKALRV